MGLCVCVVCACNITHIVMLLDGVCVCVCDDDDKIGGIIINDE